MSELESILKRINEIFKEAKLDYVIVGGIAIIHYGHIRATHDVDLIIENDSSKFPQLLKLLKSNDFDVIEDQFYKGYKENTHISIFDIKSYMMLDIKISTKESEKEIIKNSLKQSVFGSEIKIASLEQVLIGKILYLGNIDEVPDSDILEYQDVFDFLTLYHSNKQKIDEKLIEEKIKEVGLESTLNRLKSFRLN
ncbi:MAG: hypothetical protein EAX96_17630 [Candidatus Lokiarchaeota archaeon]|nr:hypothetical protein [Candidatus Lokiarchaeota archaeon]